MWYVNLAICKYNTTLNCYFWADKRCKDCQHKKFQQKHNGGQTCKHQYGRCMNTHFQMCFMLLNLFYSYTKIFQFQVPIGDGMTICRKIWFRNWRLRHWLIQCLFQRSILRTLAIKQQLSPGDNWSVHHLLLCAAIRLEVAFLGKKLADESTRITWSWWWWIQGVGWMRV